MLRRQPSPADLRARGSDRLVGARPRPGASSAALRTLSSCGIGLLVPAKKSAGIDTAGSLWTKVWFSK